MKTCSGLTIWQVTSYYLSILGFMWNNHYNLQPHKLTTLQLHNLTTLQPYNLTTLQPHNLTTLQLHDLTTSQPYNLTTLQPYNLIRFIAHYPMWVRNLQEYYAKKL